MALYILKRVLLFIPTLVLITMMTFAISRLVPADPAALKVGASSEQAKSAVTKQQLERIREQWHLNDPVYMQYYYWVSDLVRLDFGKSLKSGEDVMTMIWRAIPMTLVMGLISTILAYLIAIPIGIKSSQKPGGAFDRLTSTGLFMLYSLPSFWIGTLALIYLTRGSGALEIFPPGRVYSIDYDPSWSFLQKAGDVVWHLILPTLIYTYGSFAYISRQMRGSMLETLRQDYIRTARAKGLAERVVVWKHALRNSLIPIITLLSSLLPSLIGGAVVIETIFSIPGMGQLATNALREVDYPIIMGELVIAAVLTMISVLLSDLLYSVVDPRIAFDKKSS